MCVQDKHGVTTLIRAAHKGLVDVVKLLVESKKVDVDAVSDEKITALIAAAGEGHEAVGASTAPPAHVHIYIHI
jgi:ankyrin repeat protein